MSKTPTEPLPKQTGQTTKGPAQPGGTEAVPVTPHKGVPTDKKK